MVKRSLKTRQKWLTPAKNIEFARQNYLKIAQNGEEKTKNRQKWLVRTIQKQLKRRLKTKQKWLTPVKNIEFAR